MDMNFVSAFFRVLFFSFLLSFAVIFSHNLHQNANVLLILQKKEVFWQNGPF